MAGHFNATECLSGWPLADGTNNRLDLRGMFVRGPGGNSGKLGTSQQDVFQGHVHQYTILQSGYANLRGRRFYTGDNVAGTRSDMGIEHHSYLGDGTNGVPRTANVNPPGQCCHACLHQRVSLKN